MVLFLMLSFETTIKGESKWIWNRINGIKTTESSNEGNENAEDNELTLSIHTCKTNEIPRSKVDSHAGLVPIQDVNYRGFIYNIHFSSGSSGTDCDS